MYVAASYSNWRSLLICCLTLCLAPQLARHWHIQINHVVRLNSAQLVQLLRAVQHPRLVWSHTRRQTVQSRLGQQRYTAIAHMTQLDLSTPLARGAGGGQVQYGRDNRVLVGLGRMYRGRRHICRLCNSPQHVQGPTSSSFRSGAPPTASCSGAPQNYLPLPLTMTRPQSDDTTSSVTRNHPPSDSVCACSTSRILSASSSGTALKAQSSGTYCCRSE